MGCVTQSWRPVPSLLVEPRIKSLAYGTCFTHAINERAIQSSSALVDVMTLYHVTWCPDCITVRQKLEELGLEYEGVLVADFRPFRKDVVEVSGQNYVPVLKDGEMVFTETEDIIGHLEKTYRKAS